MRLQDPVVRRKKFQEAFYAISGRGSLLSYHCYEHIFSLYSLLGDYRQISKFKVLHQIDGTVIHMPT